MRRRLMIQQKDKHYADLLIQNASINYYGIIVTGYTGQVLREFIVFPSTQYNICFGEETEFRASTFTGDYNTTKTWYVNIIKQGLPPVTEYLITTTSDATRLYVWVCGQAAEDFVWIERI